MTKRERIEMENKIRQVLEEPYNPSDERIEEIKQRAFSEYQRWILAQQAKTDKPLEQQRRKARSLLGRIRNKLRWIFHQDGTED